MQPNRYVVGVDFGTLSARAVVVRTGDGARLHDHFGRGGDDVIHRLRRPRAVKVSD